jgi:hypothetical protein
MSATVEQAAPVSRSRAGRAGVLHRLLGGRGHLPRHPFSSEKPIAMRIDDEVVHRGFWVQTRTAEQPSPDNPNPLTATYLWGYDPETGRSSAKMTYGGYRFALRDTFTRRGDDEFHHLGEVDLGQGWIPVDEERARRRRRTSQPAPRPRRTTGRPATTA